MQQKLSENTRLYDAAHKKMTKDELIAKLDDLDGGDPESDHGNADQWVDDFLRAEGHADVVDALERAVKRAGGWWYA